MKKFIPILLVVLLMVGLMPVGAFAEEPSDRIVFNTSSNFHGGRSENGVFELSRYSSGGEGWRGGTSQYWLKIRTLNGETITRIEAKVGSWGKDYGKVGVSRGLKQPDGAVPDGSFVSVNSINSSEFSFTGGSDFVFFTEIKVYYADNGAGSTLSEGNVWIICAVVAAGGITALVISKKKKTAAE